jgi:PHD/YefM family antitoxin component YafN of YafNO toxin-antitoxin module
MIDIRDIHSITDFQRNPRGILENLKESHRPAVLTVNGRPEFVLQEANSYQLLLDKVQEANDLIAIREGLIQSLEEKGTDAKEFFEQFRRRHGI